MGLPDTPRRSLKTVSLYHFPQEFVGPDMAVLVPVSVVCDGEAAAVYFCGNHAYTVQHPNIQFWEAVSAMTMSGASFASLYEKPRSLTHV